jgi:hypothetical protein
LPRSRRGSTLPRSARCAADAENPNAGPAAKAHRASGDAIAVLLVVVAVMCVGPSGIEDDASLHVAAGIGVLAVLAVKVAVLRRFHGAGRLLPALGTSLFLLLVLTWLTSAGSFLADA